MTYLQKLHPHQMEEGIKNWISVLSSSDFQIDSPAALLNRFVVLNNIPYNDQLFDEYDLTASKISQLLLEQPEFRKCILTFSNSSPVEITVTRLADSTFMLIPQTKLSGRKISLVLETATAEIPAVTA